MTHLTFDRVERVSLVFIEDFTANTSNMRNSKVSHAVSSAYVQLNSGMVLHSIHSP